LPASISAFRKASAWLFLTGLVATASASGIGALTRVVNGPHCFCVLLPPTLCQPRLSFTAASALTTPKP